MPIETPNARTAYSSIRAFATATALVIPAYGGAARIALVGASVGMTIRSVASRRATDSRYFVAHDNATRRSDGLSTDASATLRDQRRIGARDGDLGIAVINVWEHEEGRHALPEERDAAGTRGV